MVLASPTHLALIELADQRARDIAQREKLRAKAGPLKAVVRHKTGKAEDLLRGVRNGGSPTLLTLERLADILEMDLCELLGCLRPNAQPEAIRPDLVKSAIRMAAQLIGSNSPGCPLNERPDDVAKYTVRVYRALARVDDADPGKGSDPSVLSGLFEGMRTDNE